MPQQGLGFGGPQGVTGVVPGFQQQRQFSTTVAQQQAPMLQIAPWQAPNIGDGGGGDRGGGAIGGALSDIGETFERARERKEDRQFQLEMQGRQQEFARQQAREDEEMTMRVNEQTRTHNLERLKKENEYQTNLAVFAANLHGIQEADRLEREVASSMLEDPETPPELYEKLGAIIGRTKTVAEYPELLSSLPEESREAFASMTPRQAASSLFTSEGFIKAIGSKNAKLGEEKARAELASKLPAISQWLEARGEKALKERKALLGVGDPETMQVSMGEVVSQISKGEELTGGVLPALGVNMDTQAGQWFAALASGDEEQETGGPDPLTGAAIHEAARTMRVQLYGTIAAEKARIAGIADPTRAEQEAANLEAFRSEALPMLNRVVKRSEKHYDAFEDAVGASRVVDLIMGAVVGEKPVSDVKGQLMNAYQGGSAVLSNSPFGAALKSIGGTTPHPAMYEVYESMPVESAAPPGGVSAPPMPDTTGMMNTSMDAMGGFGNFPPEQGPQQAPQLPTTTQSTEAPQPMGNPPMARRAERSFNPPFQFAAPPTKQRSWEADRGLSRPKATIPEDERVAAQGFGSPIEKREIQLRSAMKKGGGKLSRSEAIELMKILEKRAGENLDYPTGPKGSSNWLISFGDEADATLYNQLANMVKGK